MMKILTSALLICVSLTASAGLPPTTTKSQLGSKSTTFNFQTPMNQYTKVDSITALIDTQNFNLLANTGFESSTATTAWTASGGTFAAETTASNVGSGVKAVAFDSNSAAQTVTSTAVAIPPGIYAGNGMASCNFKCASGTCTHTINAYDGSNVLSSATITSSSTYVRSTINFVMPSSGNIQLQIASVASNEPNLYIDDCYLGQATNIAQVSQAQFIGSAYLDTTANCTPARTNTALGAFTADTDCPGPTVELNPGPGVIQTTDADLPRFTVNNLPPGTYRVMIAGEFGGGGSSEQCFAINDGTNTRGRSCGNPTNTTVESAEVEGIFTYTSSGNRTFELYASSSSGAITLYNNANNQQTRFSIFRYPSSPEQAMRPNLLDVSGQVVNVGASNCQWSSTSSSFADYSADSDCSGGYTYLGSASAPGTTNTPGGTFSNLPAGRYLAFATGTFVSTSASGTAAECQWQLYDGTNAIASASAKTGALTALTEVSSIPGLSGIVSYTSLQSSLSLRVRVKSVSGSPTCTIDNQVTGNQFQIGLIPISQGVTAPVLVGSVTSNSNGQERIERLRFGGNAGGTTACSTSPCTISTQSGSWVSSVTRSAAGRYSVNIAAGIFSAVPVCTCIGNNVTNADVCIGDDKGNWSSTLVKLRTFLTTSAADNDEAVDIICMGPR